MTRLVAQKTPTMKRQSDIGRRDRERDPQDLRIEHAGHREGDGDDQHRDADADEVRDEDERGEDDLDADPAAALALGDAAEDPRAVLREWSGSRLL